MQIAFMQERLMIFCVQGIKKLKVAWWFFVSLSAKNNLGGFFDKLMGNKAERAEEACELYKQAATNYKLAKQCIIYKFIQMIEL